jgi:hypothetical protein
MQEGYVMRSLAIGALCAVLAAACGGGVADGEQERSGADSPQDVATNPADVPAPIIETGCLTGSEGRFVLTDLEPSGATEVASTETYQLVGRDDQLREHVGKRVRISGEAEPAQVAETREVTPSAPPATTGTGTAGTRGRAEEPAGDAEPQVTTQAQTRLEVRTLRVASVTPTGDDCLERTPR